MKTGIHFLFGQYDSVSDFRQLIDLYSSIGYNCIELPPEPFIGEGFGELTELKRYASEKNMEIIFSCGFPGECDMASSEASIREKGQEYLKQILDVMDRAQIMMLGGTFYTKWPSRRETSLPAEEKKYILERTASCLQQAAKGIEGSRMELAIEPLNRFEGFLINTAEEGAAFCNMVGNKNIGLMLDGFHMSVEENSVRDAILIAGSHIKHLHLAENNRRLPGSGEFFPWDTYFLALREVNYKGRFDIESFVTAGGSVSASVALWRSLEEGSCPEEMRQKLIDANSFIESKIKQYGLG